ncbi:cytochrome P450 [Geodermatophilus sp. TF02-6]|uniref:cytochrome P450 n=1 Tax=Geodermatophilus sp. TF02-6 TaxID=2250575 RepID=UPI000DEA1C3F|nr:cytochrome P450 [Geodermatophilus sp. TF02-6]RBY77279.1 cytochrome P450 [Geodermatophilus sp. TF02-6]
MTEDPHGDWDPRSPEVLADQIGAYDALRASATMARSDYLGWSVLRHADVVAVLHDPGRFSSAVSTHLNVPNGMDPPEHTACRHIIDGYFTPELVGAFEPTCRRIAAELVAALPRGGQARMMSGFAELFAVRVQSAYLGWPEELTEPLLQWTARNREATLARDREAMAAVAVEFDGYITQLLGVRRDTDPPPDDLTTRLLGERIDGRPFTDPELVSILRNWTVGELGTISASVGIVAHHLAAHPDVQDRVRTDAGLIGPAVDEILRIHPPLIANRRITTRPVDVGGQRLPAGERLTLLWASANRDERVFGDPDEFRLDRDPGLNLLYGAGIHVCPGAPLARLELRVLIEELLHGTSWLDLDPDEEAVRAIHPGSGFTRLPMRVR